jgi:hypothetical protein
VLAVEQDPCLQFQKGSRREQLTVNWQVPLAS